MPHSLVDYVVRKSIKLKGPYFSLSSPHPPPPHPVYNKNGIVLVWFLSLNIVTRSVLRVPHELETQNRTRNYCRLAWKYATRVFSLLSSPSNSRSGSFLLRKTTSQLTSSLNKTKEFIYQSLTKPNIIYSS